MANWFDEIITPEERKEVELAVHSIGARLQLGVMVCEYITDLIDAKFDDNAR